MVAAAPTGGIAVRWWLLGVNLAFVVLLWLRERTFLSEDRGRTQGPPLHLPWPEPGLRA